jgi:hypothetical protein
VNIGPLYVVPKAAAKVEIELSWRQATIRMLIHLHDGLHRSYLFTGYAAPSIVYNEA